MKLDNKEKLEVQNLLKLIRRSKFSEMEGLEALALARAYHWLEFILKESIEPIQSIVQQIPSKAPMPLQPVEEKNTITSAPEVSKEEPKPKKSRKKNG